MIYIGGNIAKAVILALGISLLVRVRRIQLADAFKLDDGDQEVSDIDEIRELSRHGDREYNEAWSEDHDAEERTRDDCQGYTCDFRSSCGLAPLNRIGRARSATMPYIVNGENQIYGEWPSFARLVAWDKNDRWSGCAGTLVSDKHILTAAHCVYFKKRKLTKAEVWLGDHSTTTTDRHERVYYSRSQCVPRDYINANETSWYSFDWAVLTLKTRVAFTDHIQPACLPYGFTGRPQYHHCHLVGLGLTGYYPNGTGILPPVVQKMRVQQISCAKEWYIGETGSFVGATVACYTKAGSKGSACSGDSGGPILCLDATTNRWTVIATQSAGDISCGADLLSLGVRITTSLPNIKAQCRI